MYALRSAVPIRCPNFKRFVTPGLFLLLALGTPPAFSADKFSADKWLVLGVFPHLTARQLVETYRPLAEMLEKHLQRPVIIHSAPDFKAFAARAGRGEYDILLTAPHLAWLARQQAGYRPLLKYAEPVRGLLVVKTGSQFETPAQLRGRTIALADSITVAALALQADLAAQGLRRKVDYRTVESGTHINAVIQVIGGRADAAILGLPAYNLLPPHLREQVHIIAKTAPLSSLMYLTHPRVRDAEVQAIHTALLAFGASPAGRTFMRRGGYGGYVEADGRELRFFRPYALLAQEMLRETR